MVPVIRIDDEVWKYLQERAKPLIDTPNTVLRRILNLDKPTSIDIESIQTKKEMVSQEVDDMKDSIFIVVNAAGEVPSDKNAKDGERLTKQRVKTGVDILAHKRFSAAKKRKQGDRIVMHQGGAKTFRYKYPNAGHLVAAGRIKAEARELTDKDKQDYREDYDLTVDCFAKVFGGIIFYEFPKGMAKQPLSKEDVPYLPRRGNSFIEIKPNDARYPILDAWWKANL